MKSLFRHLFWRNTQQGGLALLHGRGQFRLRHAIRASLGRAFSDKTRIPITIAFGTAFGISFSLMGSWLSLIISFLISFFITYFSPLPWRVRLVSNKPLPVMIVVNGLFAWLIGCFLYSFSLFLPVLIYDFDDAVQDWQQMLVYSSVTALMFPVLGFMIALSEDSEKLVRVSNARAKRMQRLAEEARLVALRAQINPHFFFNALNTIAALIPKSPAEAERAVELLAESLRPVLMREQPMLASLGDEVKTARAYAEMEQLRLGQRLKVDFMISPATEGIMIPSLSLQPLVENAIRHGASHTSGDFHVLVDSDSTDDQMILRVLSCEAEDRCTREAPAVSGHALHNISARLRAAYGEEARLRVLLDESHGAVASMSVPLNGHHQ